jgi:hypothetical protein
VPSKPVRKAKHVLTASEFTALLRLAETASATIGAQELRRLFPTDGGRNLATNGAFLDAPHAMTFVPEHDDRERTVEWNDDLNGYAYFSARGWIKIEASRLKRYRLNSSWLIACVLDALSWPQQATSLLDDVLWDCGQSYMGKRRVTVFVGRRVAHPDVFTDVARKLAPRGHSGSSVLLATSPQIPHHMKIPGVTIMPFVEALDRRKQQLALDVDMIVNTVFGVAPEEENAPVSCKANGHVLVLGGDRKYEFDGDKQASVIKYLCDKFSVGETHVRVSEMLEELEIRSPRLDKLFHGHETWTKAIGEKAGTCWLIVE